MTQDFAGGLQYCKVSQLATNSCGLVIWYVMYMWAGHSKSLQISMLSRDDPTLTQRALME